ncbi:MAG: Rrf2 family transcriptional regulator [Deltaproteobacteria bacterium]|nr:Rrf2 family transcriptional regulator [Deltaproteobacteria bacterium]
MDRGRLAIHVLCAMTTHQRKGTRCTLDELVAELGVRRPDVRRVLSALHCEGYVDLQRMSLTLAGFAIGQSLRGQQLLSARRLRPAPRAVAA